MAKMRRCPTTDFPYSRAGKNLALGSLRDGINRCSALNFLQQAQINFATLPDKPRFRAA